MPEEGKTLGRKIETCLDILITVGILYHWIRICFDVISIEMSDLKDIMSLNNIFIGSKDELYHYSLYLFQDELYLYARCL